MIYLKLVKKDVSVIIPCFNEEKNISFVVEPLLNMKFQEIICVNDGSTDKTEEELKKFESKAEGLKVISLKKNRGKAFAIAEGLLIAKGEIVVLLDADLRGITENTLELLLDPLIQETHDCVVGYPGDVLDSLFKPISGQRAYFRKELLPLVDSLRQKGYGLELFLNYSFRQKKVRSIVLPGVSHVLKHKKYSWGKALKWYIFEIKELLSEVLFQDNPLQYFSSTYIYPFYLQKKIIRILFIYDSVSPIGGGSQVAAISWMENLLQQGMNIKLMCNKNAIQFLKSIKKEDLILLPYINLDMVFPKYFPTLFLSQRIKREIKKFSPDIIHFHEPTVFAYQVMQYAQKNRIPTVFSYQTDFLKQTSAKFPLSMFVKGEGIVPKIFSSLQFKMCLNADAVLSLTKHYQRELSESLNKKVFLITPPVKSIFYGQKIKQSDRPKNLLAVGRLIQGKRMDVLIKMMKYLQGDFHLTLIGDGPDKNSVCSLIRKLDLEGKITHKNWVEIENLPKEFSLADLYLSSSDSETFGLTYISALASGTPCVVYDYVVSREVVPSDTAVFINSLDPRIWADKVRKLGENPEDYKALCKKVEKNYKFLTRYDEKNSTHELMGIYNSLLRKKQA